MFGNYVHLKLHNDIHEISYRPICFQQATDLEYYQFNYMCGIINLYIHITINWPN